MFDIVDIAGNPKFKYGRVCARGGWWSGEMHKSITLHLISHMFMKIQDTHDCMDQEWDDAEHIHGFKELFVLVFDVFPWPALDQYYLCYAITVSVSIIHSVISTLDMDCN